MATNLINKYAWLAETIRRARKISLADISAKWERNTDLSGGLPLPERTFHKWRIAIEELFGLCIECDRKDGYRYYISNTDDLENNGLRTWLMNAISTHNMLNENQHLRERIVLENIPSGQIFLQPIIEAMKAGKRLEMTYKKFAQTENKTYDIAPYCVRLYRQRWYVLAETKGHLLTFGLDRIQDLKEQDTTYTLPKDFDTTTYFNGCIGVMVDEKVPIEDVTIKVNTQQSNYLRTLKLHESQTEVESTDDYTIFQLRVRPTIDFQQELLMQGCNLEVLAPQWLREKMKENALIMLEQYGK